MFGPRNPFLAWVGDAAEGVRAHRQPIRPDNPLLAAQERMSQQIVDGLEAWRTAVEKLSEETFLAVYGAPAVQAALGVDAASRQPPRKAEKSLLHRALVETRIAELRREMTEGGLPEALVRALLYVGMTRDSMDERGFEAIRRVRSAHPRSRQMTVEDFKMLARHQFFMLLIDREAALNAIPGLMPDSAEERRAAFETLREVLAASGALNDVAAERLGEVATLFGLDTEPVTLVPRGADTGRKAS
jgi:hypothetical protein